MKKNYLNYHTDLQSLCSSLSKLGIKMFCYHRIFPDNTEIMLSNNPKWSEQYYQGHYLIDSRNFVFNNAVDFANWIWPLPEEKIEALSDCRSIADIFHGFSLLLGSKEYIEGFGFGIESKNMHDFSVLLNNRLYLENFCLEFRQKINFIIDTYSVQRICYQKQLDKNQLWGDCLSHLITSKEYTSNEDFFSLFFKKRFILTSRVNLTPREMDCIKLLMLGKTAKEIGNQLFLSQRTIESYLESIKIKIGCQRKSQVISHLFKLLA